MYLTMTLTSYSDFSTPTPCSYMDRYQMFTHSPSRFPQKEFQDLIETLHKNDQHMVVILDPGVNTEDGNAAYEEGKRRDIFMKIRRNDEYRAFIGRVWPGKVGSICL